MSSVNGCLRARLTFLNLSNSVSTGGTSVRAGTLGGAGLDFFEREETGSMWAAVVETLDVATVADGTT